MKVTTLSLKMFLDSITAVEKSGAEVKDVAEQWLRLQDERVRYGSVDQEWVAVVRRSLERKLEAYREQLSHTYDLQGDKGLVNFEPTGFYEPDEEGAV